MKKWIAAAAAAVATTAIMPMQADAASSKTIAAVLTSDGNTFDRNSHDFDIVTQAVLLFPDLVSAASDANASLTVFAPTDQAFRILVHDLSGKWIHSEKAIFEAVAKLGTDTVKNVLLYHIVGSKISARDAVRAVGKSIPTLLDGASFTVRSNSHRYLRLQDLDTNDRDPRVDRVNIGGRLANGYIHAINRVLRPVDLP